MVPCSWIVWGVPTHLPWTVINLAWFCNLLVNCALLGYLKYNQMNMLPPIPPKRYAQKTQTSKVLGVISIISTLIALRITISFYDYLLDDGAGWPFVFFLVVIPLMIFSFILSMNGIRHRSATLGGKRLCINGLILTFSPILMLFIMYWIKDKWFTAQWTPCPIRDTKECFLSTHVATCSLKGYLLLV